MIDVSLDRVCSRNDLLLLLRVVLSVRFQQDGIQEDNYQYSAAATVLRRTIVYVTRWTW